MGRGIILIVILNKMIKTKKETLEDIYNDVYKEQVRMELELEENAKKKQDTVVATKKRINNMGMTVMDDITIADVIGEAKELVAQFKRTKAVVLKKLKTVDN